MVGITVELSWTTPGTGAPTARGAKVVPAPDLIVSISDGAITGVISWPPAGSAQNLNRLEPGGDGNWHLGPAAAGRVRARLEVTAAADLLVRRDENQVRIPVLAILERGNTLPPSPRFR